MKELPVHAYCPQCRAVMTFGDSLCTACGSPVYPRELPKAPLSMRRTFGLLLAGSFFAYAGFCCLFGSYLAIHDDFRLDRMIAGLLLGAFATYGVAFCVREVLRPRRK